MPTPPRHQPRRPEAHAERDRGLDRIRQLTRWTAVSGLALTGGLSALAASGFTGHAGASTRPLSATLPALPGPALTAPTLPTTTTTVPPATVPPVSGSRSITPATNAPETAPPTTATTVPYVPQTFPPPPVTQSGGS